MFGNDLLKKQQEVINKKEEEKRRDEAEKRKKAMESLEEIKKDLLELANAGENRLHVWYEDTMENCARYTKMDACYESLRNLGWEEGISIKRTRGEYNDPDVISASVPKVSIRDSYESMFENTHLDKKKIMYLRAEHDYALRINNGESIFELQEEIAKSKKVDKEIAMLALANAAYKNGLEGEIPELEGISRIESTLKTALGYNCTVFLENHTEILHYIYKEKRQEKKEENEIQKVKQNI